MKETLPLDTTNADSQSVSDLITEDPIPGRDPLDRMRDALGLTKHATLRQIAYHAECCHADMLRLHGEKVDLWLASRENLAHWLNMQTALHDPSPTSPDDMIERVTRLVRRLRTLEEAPAGARLRWTADGSPYFENQSTDPDKTRSAT